MLRNGSSNLPRSDVPKGPAHSHSCKHYSKIAKLVLATRKHRKSDKKFRESKKIANLLEQSLPY